MTGRLRPTAPLGRDRGGEDGQDQRHHQAVQERDFRDHVSLMGMDDGDEGECIVFGVLDQLGQLTILIYHICIFGVRHLLEMNVVQSKR